MELETISQILAHVARHNIKHHAMVDIVMTWLYDYCMPMAFIWGLTCRDFYIKWQKFNSGKGCIIISYYIICYQDMHLYIWALANKYISTKWLHFEHLMKAQQKMPYPSFTIDDMRVCINAGVMYYENYESPWIMLTLARPSTIFRRIAEYQELAGTVCRGQGLPNLSINNMLTLFKNIDYPEIIPPPPNSHPDETSSTYEELARILIVAPIFGDLTGIDDMYYYFDIIEPATDEDDPNIDLIHGLYDSYLQQCDDFAKDRGFSIEFPEFVTATINNLVTILGDSFDYKLWMKKQKRFHKFYELHNNCMAIAINVVHINILEMMRRLNRMGIHRVALMFGAKNTTLQFQEMLYYRLYTDN